MPTPVQSRAPFLLQSQPEGSDQILKLVQLIYLSSRPRAQYKKMYIELYIPYVFWGLMLFFRAKSVEHLQAYTWPDFNPTQHVHKHKILFFYSKDLDTLQPLHKNMFLSGSKYLPCSMTLPS